MKTKIEVILLTKNHIEHFVQFPTTKIVCPRCDGEGSHVNEAIDGNGLSQDQVDDPDFMEDYLSGHYDVRCTCCKGKNVITVVDDQFIELLEKSHPRIFNAYWRKIQEVNAYEAEERARKRSIANGHGGW